MPNSNRFSRKFRLLNKTQFQAVFAARQRLFGKHYLLYHFPNQQPYARLGVITSKRNAKWAVWRNAIRRDAREVFRQHGVRQQPLDIIVIAKHSAAMATHQERQQCLDTLYKRLLKA